MASNRCAVCKILNVTCEPTCICKPHFPSNSTRFQDVHQIFGAENVLKILNSLGEVEREIAANCLCYAAEARRRDPVSGVYGMKLHYESILNDVEQEIKSALNELETNLGPDQVPKYFDIPIPDDFLNTTASLDSYIEKIKNLTTVEKNNLLQFWKRENQKMGDDHRVDGASTSAGPSTALGEKHQ
ncbi:hypothetical protein CARUB_v10006407mg [Capsella rubella]|uniref:LOB domain-containing protein n=1 Tax=Capsella rubella TaxID=81985 RepID=R0GTP6_9BRAS|nr:LOB domain-containing protein 32 [Capsella rubella]EOA15695.1 hypothetical protein CARUB_v10006407mg [Capsella rubella]